MQKENIPLENVLIVADDLALPFGSLRMKMKGSHGGHNGLRNIEAVLNNNQYTRLRFGIAAEFKEGQQVDYVLGQWNDTEKETLTERIEKFSQAALSFVFAGVQNTMTGFNGK
jgi:PTH1 family peptidyl-tRNA hydrolase